MIAFVSLRNSVTYPFPRTFILLFTCIALIQATLSPSAIAAPIPVAVSILPQKYFVEKIAGQHADVMVMVRPGASPATYEPRPGQMKSLQSGTAYFAVGVPFEKIWLPKIAALNPDLKVIHTEKGILRTPMVDHGHRSHAAPEGDRKNHVHAGKENFLDPHIWLAPNLVKVQARNIVDGLKRIDPEHGDEFERNYESFIARITTLHHEITDILSPIPSSRRVFMIFHPSWGYFARAYRLRQIPIESEGKEPGPRKLARIIDAGKKLGIRTIFVQKQFSSKSAGLIAAGMQAHLVPLDPLAENWDENLIKTARAITASLKKISD